jgi:hypothetical protein
VFGTVASVNGTSTTGTCGVADTTGTFTLTDEHGTTDTVDVATTTTFSEHATTPSFVDVCVGGKVGAVGTISSGTVSATAVFVTPPPTPKPHAVFGTVASVNGTSTAGTCGTTDSAGAFTLSAFHSTTDTVDVATTTTFSERGVTTPSFVDVCVGGKVGAVGTISSGTVTATAVFVFSPPTSKLQAVFGTVASVNGTSTAGTCGVADTTGTFTMTDIHGTTDTVDVATTTTFSEHGVTAPSFVDVCVGAKVGAVGTISSGTVTATAVFASPSMTAGPPIHASLGTSHGAGPQGSTKGSHPTSGPFEGNHGGSGKGTENTSHFSGHSSGHHSH